MAIHFFEEDVQSRLKNKLALKKFIKGIVQQHLPEVMQINMTYIFCDDAYLLTINQQFLQHDTYTDIITFDLSEESSVLEAEIYISVERVSENAKKYDADYNRELHRVIFHGALHLAGFKDKKKEEAAQMRAMEEQCLVAYIDNKG